MHDFWPMTSDAHRVHACSRWRHWIWVRLGAPLVGLTPKHHYRPCVVHPITQRLLVRSACKLDAFKALNKHFNMHDFWPMTLDAHRVHAYLRWRHWIWVRLGADLVGLAGSWRSHYGRRTFARLIPQRLLVRSACKLDAFEALNELFKLISKVANHHALRKSYSGAKFFATKLKILMFRHVARKTW